MKKRITALLLAVVSILSMLTAPASAAAPDTIKMDDCARSEERRVGKECT